MAIADANGMPLAVLVASASPHEIRLVEATVAARFTEARPVRLIGDQAYDRVMRWIRHWRNRV